MKKYLVTGNLSAEIVNKAIVPLQILSLLRKQFLPTILVKKPESPFGGVIKVVSNGLLYLIIL